MDWRLALVPLALLGVLFGGSVLVAQVESDLNTQIGTPVRESHVDGEPPGLNLRGFKLPSDVPITLPPGTKISPDLSKLTLPENMDLQLPEGLDLSDLKLDLPEDFDFELPEGSFLTPEGLQLPNGGSITLPDGTKLDLPPGTNLQLPPELIQQLLRNGVPFGELPTDFRVPFRNVPRGTQLTLDPPAFGQGGSLRLPKGSEIQLPPGTRLPAEAGALAHGMRYLLPAGTSFDIPSSGAIPGASAYPFPGDNGTPPAQDAKGVAVETEITDMPSRVRKGEPFVVGGYVREAATGRPVAGAHVDVFVNETKALPGTLVGQGFSTDAGRFRVTVTLPKDQPASDYQLVNRARAFTAKGGVEYAEGWGDPPFATYAGSALTLVAPSRAGIGAQLTLRGSLTDDAGLPVAGAPVRILIDGALWAVIGTEPDGTFSLPYTFRTTGTHTVTASFQGDKHHEPAADVSHAILVDEGLSLEVPTFLTALRGGHVQADGRALLGGSPAPGITLDVTLPWDSQHRVVTDAQGRFQVRADVPLSFAPGLHRIGYAAPDHAFTQEQLLEVRAAGVLQLEVAALGRLHVGPDVDLRLVDEGGRAIVGQDVQVVLSGPGGVTHATVRTGPGSVPVALLPATPAEGTYTVTARMPLGSSVTASPTSATTLLGELVVTWEVPRQVLRNQDTAVSVRVSLGGQPLPAQKVVLELAGVHVNATDDEGHAGLRVHPPASTPLGPTTARLRIDDLAFTESRTATIVAQPTLELVAPDRYRPGETLALQMRFRDDNGAPMAGRTLLLELAHANGSREERVASGPDGSHAWDVNVSEDATGQLVLRLRAPATGYHLEAEASRTLSLQSAGVGGSFLPWALPVLGLAAIGAAGGGVYLFQKRRALQPLATAAPIAAATVAPVPTAAPDLALALGIPADEPQVWGIGEELPLELRALTPAPEGTRVRLEGPDGAQDVDLDAAGRASLVFVHGEEGPVLLRARRQGSHAYAEATLRLVEYRKELAREFDLVVDAARRVDGRIDRRATVREVEGRLLERLGEEAAPELAEMALLVERTNYGTAAVTRRDYLRFLAIARTVERRLGTTDEGA